MGQDVARAPLPDRGEYFKKSVSKPISTNLASTSSASVARPASGIRTVAGSDLGNDLEATISLRSAVLFRQIATSRGGKSRRAGELSGRRRPLSSPMRLPDRWRWTCKEPLGLGSDGKPVYLRISGRRARRCRIASTARSVASCSSAVSDVFSAIPIEKYRSPRANLRVDSV